MTLYGDRHKGWVRVCGIGIAWQPAGEPMIFSQRVGIEKTYVLFKIRFSYLKRSGL